MQLFAPPHTHTHGHLSLALCWRLVLLSCPAPPGPRRLPPVSSTFPQLSAPVLPAHRIPGSHCVFLAVISKPASLSFSSPGQAPGTQGPAARFAKAIRKGGVVVGPHPGPCRGLTHVQAPAVCTVPGTTRPYLQSAGSPERQNRMADSSEPEVAPLGHLSPDLTK